MMTKKLHHQGGIAVPINPIVTEGPLPRDPLNVRIMRREIRRLENQLGGRKGGAATLRNLLISNSAEEHWEVPG